MCRPVGEEGALAATAFFFPSSCMSVLLIMSGVELILFGRNFCLFADSTLSSDPVSVPSSDKASEGPAKGEERSSRGSRRGGTVAIGDGGAR